MQIHEITYSRSESLDENLAAGAGALAGRLASGARNIASGLAQPFQDVGQAYKTARLDQRTAAVGDKAYNAWKTYKQQLLKADPTGKTLQPSLMAFVNKNLLGGMYLPNVINKDKIIGLVNQIAQANMPTTKTTAQPPQQPPAEEPKAPTGGAPSGAPGGGTAYGKNAGTTASYNVPTGVPDPRQAAPGPRPSPKTTTAPSAPGKQPTVRSGPVTPAEREAYEKKLAAAAAAQPAVTEDIDPAQEKALFLQLVQQAAVATTQASGTGQKGIKDADDDTDDQATDSRGYVEQFRNDTQLTNLVKSLPAFATKSDNLIGNRTANSTGNPVADAVLLLSGFRGL